MPLGCGGSEVRPVADRSWENQVRTDNCSAFFIMMTELLDSIADSITDTEATEEPVIRVATVVVYGAAVATVVIAVLASRGSRSLLAKVPLGGAGRRGFFRHLGWTARLVFVKVGSVRVASWDVRV